MWTFTWSWRTTAYAGSVAVPLSGSIIKLFVLEWVNALAVYTIWILMTYLTNVWKMNFTHAANVVNTFNGVATIMPIGMLHLAQTLTGYYWMLLLSSVAYSIGLGFLWMSTPPILSNATGTCSRYQPECIGDVQMILFYTALSLIAFGFTGHSVSLQLFYAEHVLARHNNHVYYREGSAVQKALGFLVIYAMIFSPIIGGIALPYIRPWSVRFGIQAICTLVATLVFIGGWRSYENVEPMGSNLTRVYRVFVASILKIRLHLPRDLNQLYEKLDLGDLIPHTAGLRCLDKAALVQSSKPLEEQEKNRWTLCRVTEVEETKIFLRMIPMGMTFIVIGIVLSLGNTFFLEQANNMNPKVGKLKVPLPLFLIFYEIAKSKATKYYTEFRNWLGEETRKYAPAVGLAVGMLLAILCCITAAKVEERRIRVFKEHSLVDSPDDSIPMSVFWVLPQYLLLAGLDALARRSVSLFVLIQVPASMHVYMVQFAEAVFGTGIVGAVLSVFLVGKWSERGGRQSWFKDTLNKSRLDNYYWALAALCTVNFVLYIFLALWYAYRDTVVDEEETGEGEDYEDKCCYCC